MICFIHFVAGNLSKFTRPCSSGSDEIESDVLFLNDESLVQRRFDLKENQNISSCNKILCMSVMLSKDLVDSNFIEEK